MTTPQMHHAEKLFELAAKFKWLTPNEKKEERYFYKAADIFQKNGYPAYGFAVKAYSAAQCGYRLGIGKAVKKGDVKYTSNKVIFYRGKAVFRGKIATEIWNNLHEELK